MNELLKLRKIERAIDMWWEDRLLVDFFSRDVEKEFEKEAQAAKQAQKVSKVEDSNPLKRAIKKPTTQKGFNGKRKVPSFY